MFLYVDIEKKLSSFDLEVKFKQDNRVLGFLGESGCGKSMTLKCIAGLENPTRGKIILNDKVLFDSEKKINLSVQDRKIGFLFQNYALFPHMTVKQNIEIGIYNLKKEDIKSISKKYIEKLKLEGLENRYPHELSGGQAQRVALARVLATSPDILLLDEPFSALDYHLRKKMEIELIEILKEYRGKIIFVTHDIEEAYRVCNDIMVYNNGLSKSKRRKEELFENPKSFMEAKITGCKNISLIKRINKNTIYAEDWGYELNLDKIINEDIKYMGIREQYIKIKRFNKNNSSKCFEIKHIIKNPFSYTLYIRNIENYNYKNIQIEIHKENIEFSIGNKVSLIIDPDKIIYF
ncbi:MAG: ATP-binding cassette domain-containing protein [Romboutsia sp.]